MVVLVEDGVALGFADLLKDDLLGCLRGDASQCFSGTLDPNRASDFDCGIKLLRIGKRDLGGGVGDAPVDQDLRGERREAKGLGELAGGFRVRLPNAPDGFGV